MAENVRYQRWLAISFFLVCSLVLAYFVYLILSGPTDYIHSNWLAGPRPALQNHAQESHVLGKGGMVLVKDRPIRLGEVQLTYRGVRAGLLAIDIVMLDLDPQYVYHRRIALAEARQGLQVAYQRFRIVHASGRQLTLQLIDPSL
jgi:hypothetical protein